MPTYISCCCCIIDLRKSSRKIKKKKNQVISEKEIKILLIKIKIMIIILLNTYDYLINDPPTTQSCLHDKLVMNTYDQYYELPLLF